MVVSTFSTFSTFSAELKPCRLCWLYFELQTNPGSFHPERGVTIGHPLGGSQHKLELQDGLIECLQSDFYTCLFLASLDSQNNAVADSAVV